MQQLVVFTIGGEPYALPIERVQEIVRYQPPRPVASSVPWVVGVVALRGRTLPVCDIAGRIGARPVDTAEPKIVIVEIGTGVAGIVVDAVDHVVTVPDDRRKPVPTEVATELISGVAQIGDALVMVLDVERVLAGVVDPPAAEVQPTAAPEPEPAAAPAAAPKPKPKPRRKPAARKRPAKTAQPSK